MWVTIYQRVHGRRHVQSMKNQRVPSWPLTPGTRLSPVTAY